MNECKCGRPTRDTMTVCDQCLDTLNRALGEVPWVDTELATTLTGEAGVDYRRGGGSRSAKRLDLLADMAAILTTGDTKHVDTPGHRGASKALANLHSTLVKWVKFCDTHKVRNQSPQSGLPADNAPAMSRWLMWRVDGLGLLDAGTEAVDEITWAVDEGKRLVFWKKKNRIYLGTCDNTAEDDPCPGEVYADEDAQVGACDDCKTPVVVTTRKHDIDQRLEDHLCTPSEIATYAVHLGLRASRDAVRNQVNYWSRHKRIVKRGEAPNGDPLFRYGEVRALLYTKFADKVNG